MVLPTHVGMVRMILAIDPGPEGSPHARGDGCHRTQLLLHRYVLLTYVGMARNCRARILR